MKLYTRTGDDGTTGLSGGLRVGKDTHRVRAYGEVDELNAVLGWCRPLTQQPLMQRLESIQKVLFAIGAELACAPQVNLQTQSFVPVGDEDVQKLETWIDDADAALPALRQFILPGGHESGARLHLARVVARRAERAVVALDRQEAVRRVVIQYLNRLSDLLFSWARLANQASGEPEIPWISSKT